MAKRKVCDLSIVDGSLSNLEDIDEESVIPAPRDDERTQEIINNFQTNLESYLSNTAFLEVNPKESSERLKHVCSVMHSGEGFFDVVAMMSNHELQKNCTDLLSRLNCLEKARDLNNKFI